MTDTSQKGAVMTSRQAAEFDHALERNNWSSEEVKELSKGDQLGHILSVLRAGAMSLVAKIAALCDDQIQTLATSPLLDDLLEAAKAGKLNDVDRTVFRHLLGLAPLAEKAENVVRLSVDYDRPFSALVEEAKFNKKYVHVASDKVPVGGEGMVERSVEELHLGRTVTNRELLEELEVDFVDPHSALMYACRYPDRQREYPLAILFKDEEGQLWSLLLHELSGERLLYVNRVHLDDSWLPVYRFLVSRKHA